MNSQFYENEAIDQMRQTGGIANYSVDDGPRLPQCHHLIIWLTFFLLVAAIVVGIWQGSRLRSHIETIESKANAFNEKVLRDSTTFMQPADVKYLVAESTRESFDTYVSAQGNMLSLIGILISALVAIVGIAVPVIVNNSLRGSNEIWFKKKAEEGIKQLKSKTDQILNDGIVSLKKESVQSASDVKKQLETQLNELKAKIEKLEKGAVDKIMEVKHVESLEQVAEKKNNAEKINYLEAEIKRNKENYPASGFFELGKLYLEEGKINEAINRFEIAIERNPEYVDALQALAEINIGKNNLNEALKKIEMALGIKENCYLLETRSKLCFELGFLGNALRDVCRGIELAKAEGETKCLDRLTSLKNEIVNNLKDEVVYKVGEELVQMNKVQGGEFTMGAADEDKDAEVLDQPAHHMRVENFYMGETVVTQSLWEEIMGNNPSKDKGKDLPVERVSWDDCQVFIKKLNKRTGIAFRLPSEAEWEYAARGGNKSHGFIYSGSNDINSVAWYRENSGRKHHRVKTKQPNELNLYDMSGNVWEWCQDEFVNYKKSRGKNIPADPKDDSFMRNRVCRGGCSINPESLCRVSSRGSHFSSAPGIGFRLALDPLSF